MVTIYIKYIYIYNGVCKENSEGKEFVMLAYHEQNKAQRN
jgi:hypothetical protein